MTESKKLKLNKAEVSADENVEVKENDKKIMIPEVETLDIEIPDVNNIPPVGSSYKTEEKATTKSKSLVKDEPAVEKPGLFANKKANIAFGIVAAIVILLFIAAEIYINMM